VARLPFCRRANRGRAKVPRASALSPPSLFSGGEMIVRVEELFNAIVQELLTHMLKEEQVLFLH
jgi:hypothetical protein